MNKKYNTGKPIDITNVPDEERKLAFHEWAEGSEALEQLLNQGYERGFLSHACCGGHTDRTASSKPAELPYIMYHLNDQQSRKIAMAVANELVVSDMNCEVSIVDDFEYSEEEYSKLREHLIKNWPEEYKGEVLGEKRSINTLHVTTTFENREEVFALMAKIIREIEIDKVKLPETKEEVPVKKLNIMGEGVKENVLENNLKSQIYTNEEIAENDIKTINIINVEKTVMKSRKQLPEKE